MKSQKFKGSVLTLSKSVKNIIDVYNTSDKFISNDWYQQAHNFALGLARRHKVDLATVCGIIAALSPLKRWDENKILAEAVLKGAKSGHTKLFINKALHIKQYSNGDVEAIASQLGGNKIISFFLNILNPQQTEAVTIDRHALSVILGRNTTDGEYRGMTLKQYDFFVNAYRVAGAKLNISPVKLQAITWQGWREAKGMKDDSSYDNNDEVPF